MLFVYPTLAVLIIIGQVRPFENNHDNKLELYNTYSIILLSYTLFCFTDWVDSPVRRYNIGYAMIFLTFQNIFVNLLIIVREPFLNLKNQIRQYRIDLKIGKAKPLTWKRSKTKLLNYTRRQTLILKSHILGDG